MIAKTLKFGIAYSRPVRKNQLAPVFSSDSTNDCCDARKSGRAPRSKLSCGWRQATDGRLECHWEIEHADGAAVEEPYQRRMSGRLIGRQVSGRLSAAA